MRVSTLLVTASLLVAVATAQYKPDWESIDSRPIPAWYDEAKVGIFVYWGLCAVPGFGNEWFWWNWMGAKDKATVEFMEQNFRPDWTYADFGPMFTNEFFDAEEWAEIFKASGAKYMVVNTKHHDGYSMWPSKLSFNWNTKDVGPNIDMIGLLAEAVRNKTDIHYGFYHSLFEWFNPLYLEDKENEYKTERFVQAKAIPEMVELVESYKPDIWFSDGDWEAPDTYWKSTEFLAWLYNDSPVKDTIVVNDRWGAGCSCKHGGYYTCSDRYNPGKLQARKWENAMTIDHRSWGFRKNAVLSDYLTIEALLKQLVETVSCGGNLLMNVGPTSDGRIMPIFEERLRQMGEWLGVNGEAIYGTKPWTHQNDTVTPGVWYTSKDDSGTVTVYAISLQWPGNSALTLGAVTPSPDHTQVTMLGYSGEFQWQKRSEGGITVAVPAISPVNLPCKWAWAWKIVGI